MAIPPLGELHWLRVCFRVQVKVLVINFKALHGIGPLYLRDSLTPLGLARPTHVVLGLLLQPSSAVQSYRWPWKPQPSPSCSYPCHPTARGPCCPVLCPLPPARWHSSCLCSMWSHLPQLSQGNHHAEPRKEKSQGPGQACLVSSRARREGSVLGQQGFYTGRGQMGINGWRKGGQEE